jgi:hypothetical protein
MGMNTKHKVRLYLFADESEMNRKIKVEIIE